MANEINQNPVEIQEALNQAMKEQKKKKKKKNLIIIAVVAVLIILGAIVLGGSGDDDSKPADNPSSSSGNISASNEEPVEGTIGDYICTVKEAKLVKNWEGKDSVKITYYFTNNSSDSISFDIALRDELYQNGIGLESSFTDSDDDDFGFDVNIKSGVTKEVSKVYILRDKKTAIDVEISELISFSNDKLTYTVNL